MRGFIAASVVCVFLALAARARAYESASVVDGGTITGTVTFIGKAPKPAALEVGKDRDACGKRTLYDQSLVVGTDGAIANAVVTPRKEL